MVHAAWVGHRGFAGQFTAITVNGLPPVHGRSRRRLLWIDVKDSFRQQYGPSNATNRECLNTGDHFGCGSFWWSHSGSIKSSEWLGLDAPRLSERRLETNRN